MSNDLHGVPMTPEMKREQRRKRWLKRRQWNELRFSALSVAVLGILFGLLLIFMLLFPKSKVSQIENRNLATFPKFTLSSYFSGEFTSGVATWFDDTVPFRDSLKNLGYSFKSLFGFSSENTITFINQDVVANDMNAATTGQDDQSAPSGDAQDGQTASKPEQTTEQTQPEEESQKDFTAEDAEFDMTNGLLVVNQDGHWKCLSLFGGGSGQGYADALNTLQEKLGSSVRIYSMPCPLASQFYVPSNAAEYSSDQSAAFDEVAKLLNSKITSINVCDTLSKHTEEDIYLRTDHHWAPLGAYYAAQEFAGTAGVPLADLSKYTKKVNEGYVGTMYAYSQDSRILNDPEDFTYYVPTSQYSTYYYDTAFNYQYEDVLIWDVDTASSYLMFMGGDEKIVKIKTAVNNGRKLLVIKDSYGNAEIPFYTSSFSEVYVVDMRYFDCSLPNFIQDLGITDVLFSMCSYSVVGSNADNLMTLVTQYADQHVTDGAPAAQSTAPQTQTSQDTQNSQDTQTAAQ